MEGLEAPIVSTREIVDAKPVAPQLSITTRLRVEGEDAEALWELYRAAMGPLDQVAAMIHLESRELMMQRFADPRITKVVGWDGVEPIGLGLITNDFSAVDDISADFFVNAYPEHAERDAIFYGMAVLVKPTQRGMTMFSRIYIEMWQIPARVGGVLIFDTCKFNRDNFGADDIIAHIASNFPNSSWSVIDQQTWYAAELPEPLR
ncbi:MAG: hypothetical protein ABJH68_10970 [Ilumatobacter sp.]|uniref:hypothetical protein n=1 Tax=Ilumatobacter sp. TaxID=1967498 RepID=UPI00329A0DB3